MMESNSLFLVISNIVAALIQITIEDATLT